MNIHSLPAARRRRLGRKGFTLVELSIVLVLVAILGVMTVSFTTLVSGYSGGIQKEYEFLEQCDRFERTLTDWAGECDSAGHSFTVYSNVLKSQKSSETTSIDIKFKSDSHSLHFGGSSDTYVFSAIGGVTFAKHGQMIKCTLTCASDDSIQKSFVFSLRCADVNPTEEVNAGEVNTGNGGSSE